MEQIRQAILAAEETPYSIAKGSGVNKSQISRMLNSKSDLSVDSAERIAHYLGMEIVIRPKRRTGARG